MRLFGEDHASARKEVVEHFLTLEKGMMAFRSEGPFFLGEKMSMVDVVLAPLVTWFPSFESLGKLKFPSPDQCGRIYKWLDMMRELPSVEASVPPPDLLLQELTNWRSYFAERFPGGLYGNLPQE